MRLLYFFNPKISSAETSKILQRLAKVSIAGNLSSLKYLLTVEGFIPSLSAISFWVRLLDFISSRNLF